MDHLILSPIVPFGPRLIRPIRAQQLRHFGISALSAAFQLGRVSFLFLTWSVKTTTCRQLSTNNPLFRRRV